MKSLLVAVLTMAVLASVPLASAFFPPRGTVLFYTGPDLVPAGTPVELAATLIDAVDESTSLLEGRLLRFEIAAVTVVAVTDGVGDAAAVGPVLSAGTYAVLVFFDGDSDYLPSAAAGEIVVEGLVNTAGRVKGEGIRQADGDRADFQVRSDGVDPSGHHKFRDSDGERSKSHEIRALQVDPDCRTASFAGIDRDGRPYDVYLEDNGRHGAGDVYRLTLDGAPQSGDGSLLHGDIRIQCAKDSGPSEDDDDGDDD